jgi:hypothetical protein
MKTTINYPHTGRKKKRIIHVLYYLLLKPMIYIRYMLLYTKKPFKIYSKCWIYFIILNFTAIHMGQVCLSIYISLQHVFTNL